jgi:hypothetical protein
MQHLAEQSCRWIAKDRRPKVDLRKEIKAVLAVLCEFWACLYSGNTLCVRPHSWANGYHQSARLSVQKSKSVADDAGPYKIDMTPSYNRPDQLHCMRFGASCPLPIGCIGRQRPPPQSGYRTRPYSVGKMQTAYSHGPWPERVRSAAGAFPFLGGRSEAMVRSKWGSLFVANRLPRRRISVFLLLSRRKP